MRAFSIILYIIAGLMALAAVVGSFQTWITLWGVGGAVFAALLLPIAVLAYPIGHVILTGDPSFLLGYLYLAACFSIFWLASHFSSKAEERAEAIATASYEKEYLQEVWEMYRNEYATATPNRQVELDRFMLRWQGLIKNGWRGSQAYQWLMEHNQANETP